MRLLASHELRLIHFHWISIPLRWDKSREGLLSFEKEEAFISRSGKHVIAPAGKEEKDAGRRQERTGRGEMKREDIKEQEMECIY